MKFTIVRTAAYVMFVPPPFSILRQLRCPSIDSLNTTKSSSHVASIPPSARHLHHHAALLCPPHRRRSPQRSPLPPAQTPSTRVRPLLTRTVATTTHSPLDELKSTLVVNHLRLLARRPPHYTTNVCLLLFALWPLPAFPQISALDIFLVGVVA